LCLLFRNLMSDISPRRQSLNGIRTLLKSSSVQSILPAKSSLVTIRSDATIELAFKTLSQHKILSLPVYDSLQKKFSAFIDMVDLVCFLLDSAGEEKLRNLVGIERQNFFEMTVGDILRQIRERNHYHAIIQHSNLQSAVDHLGAWKVSRFEFVVT
jgi:CBS-domain-containing membrane protein